MKILDCESIESTYESLETILGVKKSGICQLFDSIKVYEEMRESNSDFLLSRIQEKTNCKTHFDKTCWFHATRTWQDNEYDEGLLPSDQAAPKIADFLCKLVNKPLNIQVHKDKMHEEGLGPLGFLIREIAFVRNTSFTDFFKSPEIVVDNDLEELYKANTVKCIIKFVDQQTTREASSKALLYAYHKHCGRPLDDPLDSLTHPFNGKGTPVPKENICRIEFIENPLKFS